MTQSLDLPTYAAGHVRLLNEICGTARHFETDFLGQSFNVCFTEGTVESRYSLQVKIGIHEVGLLLPATTNLDVFDHLLDFERLTELPEDVALMAVSIATADCLSRFSEFAQVDVVLQGIQTVPIGDSLNTELVIELNNPASSICIGVQTTSDALKFLARLIGTLPGVEVNSVDSIPIHGSIRVGKVTLSDREFAEIENGDILIADDSRYPAEKMGSIVVNGKSLWAVRIEDEQIVLLNDMEAGDMEAGDMEAGGMEVSKDGELDFEIGHVQLTPGQISTLQSDQQIAFRSNGVLRLKHRTKTLFKGRPVRIGESRLGAIICQ